LFTGVYWCCLLVLFTGVVYSIFRMNRKPIFKYSGAKLK
jgi:cbb3-type cytochrome oxidase subunit 3